MHILCFRALSRVQHVTKFPQRYGVHCSMPIRDLSIYKASISMVNHRLRTALQNVSIWVVYPLTSITETPILLDISVCLHGKIGVTLV